MVGNKRTKKFISFVLRKARKVSPWERDGMKKLGGFLAIVERPHEVQFQPSFVDDPASL
jgi:hypothetical protein